MTGMHEEGGSEKQEDLLVRCHPINTDNSYLRAVTRDETLIHMFLRGDEDSTLQLLNNKTSVVAGDTPSSMTLQPPMSPAKGNLFRQ